MTLALSVLQGSLDGWIVVTLALVVVWIRQAFIRRQAPPLLSIEPDDHYMSRQKTFIRKTDRARNYVLGFMTASVIMGIATITAWLYQRLQ